MFSPWDEREKMYINTMNTHKSFKYRLYPTKEQEVLLSKHFGCVRFVYNHFLAMRKDFYNENKDSDKKTLNYYEIASKLIELKRADTTSWLKEVNSQSLQQSLKNLDKSYNLFFRKKNKFPRFKSKYARNSFTVPQHIKIHDNKLCIPKFKEGIELKVHREFEGKICFATISRTSTGKYFCSLTCETEINEVPKTGKSCGLDLGIKDYVILNDDSKYKNHKYFESSQKQLAYQQRQLAKVKLGSCSYKKRRLRVSRTHERVSYQRKDTLHKISTEIVKNHDIICTESLDVKRMIQDSRFAKRIQDASWGIFLHMLDYKSNWYGKQMVKIDRFFPSSQICSECGWQNKDLKLSDRKWQCICGRVHDRDVNAANNILNEGMNILSGSGTDSDTKQKLMEPSSLDEVLKSEAYRSLVDGQFT